MSTQQNDQFDVVGSMKQNLELAKLVDNLLETKTKEQEAKQARIEAEEKIAALVETAEEGQKTFSVGDLKLTVKRSLLYSADFDGIRSALNKQGLVDGNRYHIPINSKTTHTLDVAGYRWYRDNAPAAWRAMAEHVSVKPAKTSVTVKGKQ